MNPLGLGPSSAQALHHQQMIASIAQGLHLSRDERDHLFRLAGHQPSARDSDTDHIGPGMLRIFDRLTDTPAPIVNELGETLRQTPLGVPLVGNMCQYTGPSRSIGYRWFADRTARDIYPREDHEFYSRDVCLRAMGECSPCVDLGPRPLDSRSCSLLRARSSASSGTSKRSVSDREKSSVTSTRGRVPGAQLPSPAGP